MKTNQFNTLGLQLEKPALNQEQESALNEVITVLQWNKEDIELATLSSTSHGIDRWFREYTKSNEWQKSNPGIKDEAFEIFETVKKIIKTLESSASIIFPDGSKSPQLRIIDSQVQAL